MSSTIRRTGLSLAAAATLILSTVGGAAAQPTTATEDPTSAAAGWLTTQLTDGNHVYYEAWEFADAGLTADVLYSLAATGVASGTIVDIADWLETQVGTYGGPGGTAKLILAADIAGRDAENFGGQDLIANLLALEVEDGEEDPEAPPIGFYRGSWDSPLNQALALLALARVGEAPSEAAIDALLGQRCTSGGFSGLLLDDGQTCSGGNVDTTAFAIDALYALGVDEAADQAVAWLLATQSDDGSFIGDGGPSSNSTGLAALALDLGGHDVAADAARNWVLDQQAGCDTDTPGAILADPDGAGETLRATPQALLGLIGASLTTISSAGASAEIPLLDCPDPEPRELTVSCDAEGEVLPGDQVECSVSGLDSGEVVHVLVTLNPTLLDDDVAADDDGIAPFGFTVPDDAAEGDTITIVVDGAGGEVLASLSLAVGAAQDTSPPQEDDEEVLVDEPLEGTEAAAGELPRTGAATPLLGGVAGLLLLAGTLLLAADRRRSELT